MVKLNDSLSLTTTLAFSAMLSSCATPYSVSTNVDQRNFTQYFSQGAVNIYQDESRFKGQYQFISGVEGESCQTKAQYEKANLVDARTNARVNAHKLGANAVVFSGCTLIEDNTADKKCITTRVCYAKAYKIKHTNND